MFLQFVTVFIIGSNYGLDEARYVMPQAPIPISREHLLRVQDMGDNDMNEIQLDELYSQAKDRFVGIPTGDDV